MVSDYNYKGKTLILATKGTLESQKFQELYHKYDNHQTIVYECVGLADLIEESQEEKIDEYLKVNLIQFKGVENVVLGCTHYPLIKDKIKNVLGNVNLYDGSFGVAKQLKRVVTSIELEPNTKKIIFVDSSGHAIKKERFEKLIGR